MTTGWIYILESLKNGRFYVGSTNDVARRLTEHNLGRSKYTSESAPFKLVFSQEFSSLQKARKIEYWIKKQKSRDFINKVIEDGNIKKSI